MTNEFTLQDIKQSIEKQLISTGVMEPIQIARKTKSSGTGIAPMPINIGNRGNRGNMVNRGNVGNTQNRGNMGNMGNRGNMETSGNTGTTETTGNRGSTIRNVINAGNAINSKNIVKIPNVLPSNLKGVELPSLSLPNVNLPNSNTSRGGGGGFSFFSRGGSGSGSGNGNGGNRGGDTGGKGVNGEKKGGFFSMFSRSKKNGASGNGGNKGGFFSMFSRSKKNGASGNGGNKGGVVSGNGGNKGGVVSGNGGNKRGVVSGNGGNKGSVAMSNLFGKRTATTANKVTPTIKNVPAVNGVPKNYTKAYMNYHKLAELNQNHTGRVQSKYKTNKELIEKQNRLEPRSLLLGGKRSPTFLKPENFNKINARLKSKNKPPTSINDALKKFYDMRDETHIEQISKVYEKVSANPTSVITNQDFNEQLLSDMYKKNKNAIIMTYKLALGDKKKNKIYDEHLFKVMKYIFIDKIMDRLKMIGGIAEPGKTFHIYIEHLQGSPISPTNFINMRLYNRHIGRNDAPGAPSANGGRGGRGGNGAPGANGGRGGNGVPGANGGRGGRGGNGAPGAPGANGGRGGRGGNGSPGANGGRGGRGGNGSPGANGGRGGNGAPGANGGRGGRGGNGAPGAPGANGGRGGRGNGAPGANGGRGGNGAPGAPGANGGRGGRGGNGANGGNSNSENSEVEVPIIRTKNALNKMKTELNSYVNLTNQNKASLLNKFIKDGLNADTIIKEANTLAKTRVKTPP